MATPEQIAAAQQQIGRPLLPEEIVALDQGGYEDPAAQMSMPAPPAALMSQPSPETQASGVDPNSDYSARVQEHLANRIAMEGPGGVSPAAMMPGQQLDTLRATNPELAAALQTSSEAYPQRHDGIQGVFAREPQPTTQHRGGAGGGGLGRTIRNAAQARDEAMGSLQGSREQRAQRSDVFAGQVGDAQRAAQDMRGNRDVDMALAEQEANDRIAETRKVLDDKVARVEAANQAMADVPEKVQVSRRTKVLGSLAAMFGSLTQIKTAFATGVNIGNAGADVMNRAIQREVDDYERMVAQRKEGQKAAQNEYSVALQQVGDAEQAKQLALVNIREKYAQQIDEATQDLRYDEQKKAFRDAANVLREQNAAEVVQMQQGIIAAAQQEAAARARARAKAMPSAGGLVQMDPDATDQDRKKAQEIASKLSPAISFGTKLQDMARKGATISPTERAIAARRIEAMVPLLSNAFGSGAPQDAEAKRLLAVLKNPAELNIADVARSYSTLVGDLVDVGNAQMAPYNYQMSGTAGVAARGRTR